MASGPDLAAYRRCGPRPRFIDLIVVEVRAGGHSGWSYMLSFDYAPALLKGIIDKELKRHVVGCSADEIREFTSRICRRPNISVVRASPCGHRCH